MHIFPSCERTPALSFLEGAGRKGGLGVDVQGFESLNRSEGDSSKGLTIDVPQTRVKHQQNRGEISSK